MTGDEFFVRQCAVLPFLRSQAVRLIVHKDEFSAVRIAEDAVDADSARVFARRRAAAAREPMARRGKRRECA